MPVIKRPTWISYMNALCKKEFSPEQLKIDGVEKFLDISQHFNPLFHHSIPMIYLADYTSGKYLIISKSVQMIMGYIPDDFISNGIGFTLEKYHKDDLRLFNEQIFPDRLSVLKSIPAGEQINYVFSYNYRLKTSRGNISIYCNVIVLLNRMKKATR